MYPIQNCPDASLAVIIAGGLAIRNPVIIRKTSANALIQ
jgi:hypothetical protein